MKRIVVFTITALLCLPLCVRAQNFEEEFKAFERQSRQKFQHFSDSINKAFAAAMVENMRVFKGEPAKVKDPKPKPAVPPAHYPEAKPSDLPEQAPMQEPEAKPKPEPKVPAVDEPSETPADPLRQTQPTGNDDFVSFDLFGREVAAAVPRFASRLGGLQASDVADFWLELSEWNFRNLLTECRGKREKEQFNDWAICQLIFQMAEHIFPEQYNEQVVFSVFMLNQLGIEAKVGFAERNLFCLLAIEQQVYGVVFAIINGTHYYVFNLDPKIRNAAEEFSFSSYKNAYPQPTRAMDMNLRVPLYENPGIYESLAGKSEEKHIYIDGDMIKLFATYPQLDVAVYADAKPSEVFCQSVGAMFKPVLQGKSPYEAVKYLLAYVQYSFAYATDDEQFGFEKPFFCEESYYYPKNDCEDRSVLFSFLVRYLLDMDVVLIDYPGHIATAVHFATPVEGASVMHGGKSYVICDPTYIGASIGMEMPDFTPSDRTVVPLKRMGKK